MNQHYNHNKDFLYNHLGNEKNHRDKYIAMILVLIGVAGLYLIINANKNPKPTSWEPDETSITSPAISNHALKTTTDQIPKKQLKLKGILEAEEPITFIIDSYDDKGAYFLDLGNGVVKEPKEKSIRYTYRHPGEYVIKLRVSFEGKTKLIHREAISILDAIEVSDLATKIDF